MEIGVLYMSYAMLVLAELIVCLMKGFACILAKVITKKWNYLKLAETSQNELKPVFPTLKPAETSPSHSQMTETSQHSSKVADLEQEEEEEKYALEVS